MLRFILKKKNDYFMRHLTADERNAVTSVFFKHLSELYASNAMALRVPVGNFDLIKNRFYYEIGREIIKKLQLNVKLEKVGIDATKPEDRYFCLTAHE